MSDQPPPLAVGPANCASGSMFSTFCMTASQPLPVSGPMRQELPSDWPTGA